MTVRQIRAGVPADALDQWVFYNGDPIDPDSITYSITNPDTTPAVDEDGLAITDREPLAVGTGHFAAANTILPDSHPITGLSTITWKVKKFPSSTEIEYEEEFEFITERTESPNRDERSRRDIADTDRINELRMRIGDLASDDTRWAFFNSELATIFERAVSRHTAGARTAATATADDVSLSMLLAHADVMTRLATDKVKFFLWKDGSETVDKSMQPRNCVGIAKQLMDQYAFERKMRVEEGKAAGFAAEPAGDLLFFRPR